MIFLFQLKLSCFFLFSVTLFSSRIVFFFSLVDLTFSFIMGTVWGLVSINETRTFENVQQILFPFRNQTEFENVKRKKETKAKSS